MIQSKFTILSNKPLTAQVYEMKLMGNTSAITGPGQFVNIALDKLFLRRPISVCNVDGNVLTLVYKVVGKGTAQMAGMEAGAELDILTGLGNGYDLKDAGDKPLLLGGGVGVPPMYMLAKELKAMGKEVSVVLGFNTASELFYEEEFKSLGCNVTVTTADGSYGMKGFVTDAMKAVEGPAGTYVYTCGPEPMLKAIYQAISSGKDEMGGQFSFEERMGCGFGACMGCTCKTVTGYKRICKEGPVMRKEDILWEK